MSSDSVLICCCTETGGVAAEALPANSTPSSIANLDRFITAVLLRGVSGLARSRIGRHGDHVVDAELRGFHAHRRDLRIAALAGTEQDQLAHDVSRRAPGQRRNDAHALQVRAVA